MLLGVSIVALVRAWAPPWADAQDEVRAVVAARLDAARAADVPSGLQQFWIPALGRADRCATCHATILWGEELADAPHPARSHPLPELMRAHPPERFGCTLCHGGQGSATTREAAHGDVPFWEEPLLGRDLAERYGLTPAELMEMNCNRCHQRQGEVAGMPLLNEAKAQVAQRRCQRCHVVNGEGKTFAPDLTRAGEKHPSLVAYPPTWTHERTALRWHIEHFLDPESTSPGSTMQKFRLTRREATGLALLVLSWRDPDLPAAWIPPPLPPLPKPPPKPSR